MPSGIFAGTATLEPTARVLSPITPTVLASLRADGGPHRRHPRVVTSLQYSRLDGLLKSPAASIYHLVGLDVGRILQPAEAQHLGGQILVVTNIHIYDLALL